jgi:Flp pilus assembly protein TadB
MTGELEAFRAELKAAGEPWQQRGIRIVLAGFALLVVAQVISAYAMLVLYLAVAVIAVGWAFMIVAFLRRRRWAKDHANLTLPDLSDAP